MVYQNPGLQALGYTLIHMYSHAVKGLAQQVLLLQRAVVLDFQLVEQKQTCAVLAPASPQAVAAAAVAPMQQACRARHRR
jgi:hypothetical protein